MGLQSILRGLVGGVRECFDVILFLGLVCLCIFGWLGLCCFCFAFLRCSEQASHCNSSLGRAGSGSTALGLQSSWLPAPDTGSVAVAHRLGCPVVCGILPDQGSNLCLLHWQADALPLSRQGSPDFTLLQAVVHFCQHHLSKRLPFPHRVSLPPCCPSAPESAPSSSSAHRVLDKEAEPHLPPAPTSPRPAWGLRLRRSPRNCFWMVIPRGFPGLSSELTLCPAGRPPGP